MSRLTSTSEIVTESPIDRFRQVRRATEQLCRALSPEDCTVQSMPDVSPTKWHLAHVTWFFETFVLKPHFDRYRPLDPGYAYLFNSYYNDVGAQYPRPERGLLSRPGLDDVLAYRAHVDAAMAGMLERDQQPRGLLSLIELGLNHEQQHQELILMDIKHVLHKHPAFPAYDASAPATRPGGGGPVEWVSLPEGLRSIGHTGSGFAFDNEGPSHRTFVGGSFLASRAVTNREYLEFVDDQGYANPMLWLADGWNTLKTEKWQAPLYWVFRNGTWFEFTLRGLRPLAPDSPVCHVSFYEADAFASWAGARLPTEFEWESAAGELPLDGNFVEGGRLQPEPATGGDKTTLLQLFGDVWEWTRSAYAPYPGFRVRPDALGEYNGKFMCNQMVLRGGSCVTPRSHVRATYRNFFYPHCRWQFAGIRLARDPDQKPGRDSDDPRGGAS